VAGRIFINYRRDDSAPHALSIAQYMERAFGARNVFIDIDRMRAGQKFPEVLERRLAECKVMIVVIGPAWLEASDEGGARRLDDADDWVRLEIARALARDITVIPVTVGGARLPKRSELPVELSTLLDYHAVAVTTNGFRSEMAGLRDDIRAIRENPRSRWWIGAAAAAVAVVGTGVWVAAHWIGPPSAERPAGPPVTAKVDQEARGNASLSQRIGALTDRAELLGLMEQDPAERPAIMARLAALGYVQVATAELGEQWLRAGGGRDLRETFKDCSSKNLRCPEMVVVPPGRFLMGSPRDEPGRRDDDEGDGNGKQVDVAILRPLAVSRFVITFDQWDACVADGGCNGYRPDDNKWGRGRLPVINVSWDDAHAYVGWLSRKTGKTYRLLSEAEREYVTRAGTQTPFWWGQSISTTQANYNGDPYAGGSKGEFRQKTVAVDSFDANPWGLYQVHGNVWDWLEDCYHGTYAGMPSKTRYGGAPWVADCALVGDGKGKDVILRTRRGGSWFIDPKFLRSAYRSRLAPGSREIYVGFRVARTL